MKLQIEVGKRIMQIRKSLNLTREDFGKSLDTSTASLSEIENGKYNAGIELLEKLVKKYNVNLHFVITGEGDMFISPAAAYYSRMENFAVNLEDVRDFFYHFEHSLILQYFIMAQYKTRMMLEGDLIIKEINEKEEKQQEQKEKIETEKLACPEELK
jgi:transcriptional regulator with XRE-family HTH domain